LSRTLTRTQSLLQTGHIVLLRMQVDGFDGNHAGDLIAWLALSTRLPPPG